MAFLKAHNPTKSIIGVKRESSYNGEVLVLIVIATGK
jgi:hypothetical protein